MTKRIPASCVLAAVFAIAIWGSPAQAQPTEAQRDAVRSACRSDYMANCSSVTPGGMEALQCLQRNESKLSGACKSAVNSISAAAKPAEPAAEKPAQAKAEPEKPATEKAAVPATPAASKPPAAEKPAAAKPAPKPATAATSPKPATASAPPATTPAPPKRAAQPPKAAAAPPAAPADPGPGPAPPPLPLAQIPPRFELGIMRSCRYETQTLCALPAGDGRILNCLAANQASVSAGCSDALDRARAAAR